MPRFIAAFCVVALLGFAGCGGSKAPKTARQPVESIDVALEGTWRGQMLVNEEEAAKKLQADQIAALKEIQMEMTFREDGSLTLAGETNGAPYTSQNRWDLVDVEGNKLTIKSIDSDGSEKNIDLFFNDSNSFDMPLSTEVAELGAMRFTRVR